MINTTSVIIIVGIVFCLLAVVLILCFYITIHQRKLKEKINKATNSEVRRQRREELLQEKENIMQILEQTKAMKELNTELTKTQRRENARFHT